MKRPLQLFFALFFWMCIHPKNGTAQHIPNEWAIGYSDTNHILLSRPVIMDLSTFKLSSLDSNRFLGDSYFNIALGDSLGRLIFFSLGGLPFNDSGRVIAHNSYNSIKAQRNLLVKRSGSDSLYHWYFIAEPQFTGAHGVPLYECIISVNNSKSRIKNQFIQIHDYGRQGIQRATLRQLDRVDYFIQSTPHCNGRDHWIWYWDRYKKDFVSFLLDSSGTDTTPNWSNLVSNFDFVLDIKTSPLGTIVIAAMDLGDSIVGYTAPPIPPPIKPYYDSTIVYYSLLNFNNQTGKVTGLSNFDSTRIKQEQENNDGAYYSQFEFSSSGNYLFALKSEFCSTNKQYLKRYELNVGTILNSMIIDSAKAFAMNKSYFCDIARIPDGRIVISNITYNSNTEYYAMDVLMNPNDKNLYSHRNKILNINNQQWIKSQTYTFPRFSAGFTPESFIVSEGYCFGDSARFWLRDTMCLDSVKWNFGDPASGSANLSTLMHPTHVFSAADTFFVQLYRFYPSRADTIQKRIILQLPDTVHASNDTLLCAGDTIGLHTNLTYPFFYSWSNGSTDSNIIVSDSGWYHVTVVGECNVSKDSVYVAYASTPVVDLGNDTILCKDTLVLAATWPLASYLWSSSDTTDSIQTLQSGLYRVTATNICGSDADTIQVKMHPIPQPNIPDTSVCAGKSIRISIPFDYTSYIWSNWTASNNILINSPGKYWVQTQNLCGTFSDTFFVAPSPGPQVELGNDTLICKNSPLLLNGFHQHNDSYFWRHNASSDSVVSVNSTNLYHLVVSNGCGTASDSVFVSAIDPPLVNLGADTAICLSDSILLTISGTHDSSSYQWTPLGANTPNYWAKDTGIYRVLVTNQCGADSSQQRVLELPIPSSNFVKDTILCDNASWTLSASNPKAFYLWSTGSLDSSISINQQGSYWVTITNPCGVLVDSTTVEYLYSPTVKLTSDQTKALCLGTPIEILATATGGSLNFLWDNGDTSDKMVVTQPGPYSIKVSNRCGIANAQINPSYVNLKADFVLDKTQGEAPLVIKPSDQSLGATSSRWFLDSTLISVVQQPTSNVKIIAYGKHALMLVTTNGSCTDTTFQEIEVLENTNLPPRLCDFDIRPNPSSGEFFLTALNTDKQVREIRIFDKHGAIVFQTDVSDYTSNPFFWPAPQGKLQLAAGTYTIGLFCEEETVYHRLVID